MSVEPDFNSAAEPPEILRLLAREPAVLLMSPRREVYEFNFSAEAMLRDGRWGSIDGGRLVPASPAVETALEDLLGKASQRGHRMIAACPDAAGYPVGWAASSRVLIAQASARAPIQIAVRAMIKAEPLPGSELAAVFALTPAEARLAVELSAGLTLAEIAESRSANISTLRAQLRSVYAKLGVSKQAELVATVWRVASV